MRNSFFILGYLSLFQLAVSCTKSDNTTGGGGGCTNCGNPGDKTVAALSGSYNLTALSLNTNGVIVDEFAGFDACVKDNIFTLNQGLTFNVTEGILICDPPQDSSGTWKLSANSDSLILNAVGQYIKSWNGKTLVLTLKEISNSQILITTSTFVKQ